MNDRWHDPAALRRDHDIALRLLDIQGLIRCMDQQWVAETKRLFLHIVIALQNVVMGSVLSLVYCYDQHQQPSALAKNDGYSSVSEHKADGRRVASIGISIQALQHGDEYAVMVLLHELTHIRPLAKLNRTIKIADTSNQGEAESEAISAIAITL